MSKYVALILTLMTVFACTEMPQKASNQPLAEGHALMAAGDYENAIKKFRQAIAQNGLENGVLSAIGGAELKLGRLGEAERVLRTAIALNNNAAPAWNNLGVVLINTSRLAEAKRSFEIALSLAQGDNKSIKANLSKTVALIAENAYTIPKNKNDFELIRAEDGNYLLLETAA